MRVKDLKLPEVGEFLRCAGELVRIEEVTPPVRPVLDFIFRTECADVIGRVGGKKIKEFVTFNDLYGQGTGVQSAINEAGKLAKSWGAGLEIVVVKRVHYFRARPSVDGESSFYDKGYRNFEPIPNGCQKDVPDETEEIVFSVQCG